MYQGYIPSVTSVPTDKKYENLKEATFIDKDGDIHDPILSTQSVYEAIKILMENSATIDDLLNLFNSNLIRAVVPQTYNFPKLV